jgi:hypothetical protein
VHDTSLSISREIVSFFLPIFGRKERYEIAASRSKAHIFLVLDTASPCAAVYHEALAKSYDVVGSLWTRPLPGNSYAF